MNAGDPKKAAVLSVVAIAILGVAVVRIIPKSEPPVASALGDDAAASSAEAGKDRFDRTLRRNPFYHPGLDIIVRPADDSQTAEPLPDLPPLTLPPLQGGQIPAALPGSLDVRPVASGEGEPAETTGTGQQEKQKHKVLVNAVLQVAKPLAYVKVGDEEFRVGVGDEIPQIGKVLSITARGVVVKTALGKVTLVVGESVEI